MKHAKTSASPNRNPLFDNRRASCVESLALPMKEITESLGGGAFPPSDEGLEERIFRVMAVSVAVAASIAVPLAPWRITTGLLLGGLLSLLNYRWMRMSIVALIEGHATRKGAVRKMARYIVRYFLITGVAIAAYKLNAVSVPATIIGLCSFVIALFAEAFRQVYFTIVGREGIN